eukprot:CAMPEP_0194312080 /NCGR_PEP_ID=MMETSP0171-20130528/9001_1 /TAXON_ID=218684 /ORGANISM="Corethron pennatum, Strain L29A3" /LENGTH=601 /DNA_ID=CAMNT_0039066451 /DNA_START=172 /DNA_END=1977 /DNA_ORIENTATION=+
MDNLNAAKNTTEYAWNKHAGAFNSTRKSINDATDDIERGFAALKIKQDLLSKENEGADVDDEDVLEINAGGKIVKATRKNLTQLKGTRLEALFSGRWEKQLQRDRDGRVFLDVNASCFRSIVDYLSELAISSPDDLPEPPHVDEADTIFLYRLLTVLGIDEGLSVSLDSIILKEEEYQRELYKFLDVDNLDGNLELLYRGSRDGYSGSTFHEKCNNQGATVTVIKSTEGFVFGGFADLPWTSDGDYHASPKAFLFALKSHSGIESTKMRIQNNRAVYHDEDGEYGPTFGDGHDLHIANDSNTNRHSYLRIGSAYNYPPGQTVFITGERNFRVDEIEVFSFGSTNRYLSRVNKKENVDTAGNIEECATDIYDEFPADVKTAIIGEKKALEEATKQLQKQIHAFELEKHFIDTFVKGETEDIIQFDVGGECMAVKRSTLGRCRDSVLAKQFDDPLWTRNGTCPSVKDWDFNQVAKWASEQTNIPGDVAQKLSKHKINGSELLLFGRDDLKDLGIDRLGTLATVISAINELKKSASDNVIFVEQSAYCFGKIIDQLRLRNMCQPGDELPPGPNICEPEKKRFKRIVEYYFPGEEASSFILGPSC